MSDVDLGTAIGEVVRLWRTFRGLTAAELVEQSGPPISRSYLSQLEHGKIQQPGDEHLLALARALKISVSDLLTRRLPQTAGPDRATLLSASTLGPDEGASADELILGANPPGGGWLRVMTDQGHEVEGRLQLVMRIKDSTGALEGRRVVLRARRRRDGRWLSIGSGYVIDGTLVETVLLDWKQVLPLDEFEVEPQADEERPG